VLLPNTTQQAYMFCFTWHI